MTTLSFALSRTAGREFRPGDEILCTKLDHDANVSPWLELAHDRDLTVRFVDINEDTTLDLDDLERAALRPDARRRLPGRVERGRDADRRPPDRRPRARGRRDRLGRRRPLRAARADRRRRVRRRRADLLAVQVLRPASRRSRSAAASCSSRGGRTRCARRRSSRSASASRPGTLAVRAARRLRRRSRVRRVARLGGHRRLGAGARASGSSPGCRRRSRLHGLPGMDGRVPTFAFSVDGISAEEAAARLGERGFAVWYGNYYALEVMKRLGLEDDGGAVRVGFVHYNTRRRGRPAPRGARPAGVTRAERMGGARRARPPLDRAPGLGGARGARAVDRAGRDGATGCSAAASGCTARWRSSAGRRRTTPCSRRCSPASRWPRSGSAPATTCSRGSRRS